MLKQFLLNNENARKIFGRREIEIIIKQISGEKLTQSERNRLSRDIRPKFEFIQEIAKLQNEFELKNNQDNLRIIKKASNVILNEAKTEIKAIFLFGSFADKTFRKESDIDICVIFRRDISLREATNFRIRVLGELSEKADVQVFNVLPQKIKRDIARNHRIIYRAEDYDDLSFSISYLKDDDYFIRFNKVFNKNGKNS